MTGTIVNAILIIISTLIGILSKSQLPVKIQNLSRTLLAGFTFFLGIKLVVKSFDPGFATGIKSILAAILSLILGNLIGKLIKLQVFSNKLGNFSKNQLERCLKSSLSTQPAQSSNSSSIPNSVEFASYQETGTKESPSGTSELFNSTEKQKSLNFVRLTFGIIILFCLNPVGIIGSVYEGISQSPTLLIIKAVMEFFFSLSLARYLILNILAAVVVMVLWQGAITNASIHLAKWTLFSSNLTFSSCDALVGFFCFIFVLPILEIKRVELANYLPSILIMPLIAKIFS